MSRGLGLAVDSLLDRTLIGYTTIGPAVRRRLPSWPDDLPSDAYAGRQAIVTGATSGLGFATAEQIAGLGGAVHLVVRDADKGASVRDRIVASHPGASVEVHRCDVADLDDVRRFAGELTLDRLDLLVHNAGAMPPQRTESPQAHEQTMALHVLGPVLMTEMLRPALRGNDARVVLVTSGGMYAQRLRADDPEYLDGDYSPTTAYARSKRAQVELLPTLQQHWSPDVAAVCATHPGWADTPGVVESLPRFHAITGPVLRDADGGAETTVWLGGVRPAPPGGGLWHDRRERPTHYARRTRSGTGDVERLWSWVREATGV